MEKSGLSKDSLRPILILMGIFLLLRLPLILYLPFIQDECVYAIMIEEQRDGLTAIPTFLDYPVSWKPMLFFWLHAILPPLPGPVELTYRVPSMLFGLASLAPLFLFLRNAGASKAVAFISLLLFQVSYVTSYPNTVGLIDSMLFFQIALSLFVYSEERLGRWRFLIAGALAFTAYLTKLAIAAMIPILAVAYFLFVGQRKTLGDPLFLLSLLAVPSAALCIFLIFQSADLGTEMYTSYILHQLISRSGIVDQTARIWSGFNVLLVGAGIWCALSLAGFVRHWKENRFMAVWYLLTIFPLLGGYFMVWYFLPVMPAICYFASLALLRDGKKEKLDKFFSIILVIFLAISAVGSLSLYVLDRSPFVPQKEAGLLLAGKENVLYVGTWAPGAIAYKVVSERRAGIGPHDFGWVQFTKKSEAAVYHEFIADYETEAYEVNDGSFSGIYAAVYDENLKIFRKDTSITRFDYLVVTGLENFTMPGAEPIYKDFEIMIFRIGG